MKNFNPNRLLLGFTATPNRTDNQGMEEFYQVLAANRDILWGVENKWLCEPRAWRINTSINLDEFDLKDNSGEYGKDFSKKELEKAVNIPARNKLVMEKFLEYSEGYRGIFFCVDVQHAKDLCAMANSMGISSSYVVGSTEKNERAARLKAHREGKYRCLMSVNCFIEGYNDTGVVVACMCRPTKSELFYQQAIGRVLRPHPAPEKIAAMRARGEEPEWIKPYSIILDFCDLSSKHRIVTASSIFGLGVNFDCKGKSVVAEAKKMQEQIAKLDKEKQDKIADHMDDIASIEDLYAVVEKIDLLEAPQVSQEIAKFSSLEWLNVNGKHEISLPGNDVIRIFETPIGGYYVQRFIKGYGKVEGVFPRLDQAVGFAEDKLIPEDHFALLNADAAWKKRRPSDAQINYLSQLRPDLVTRFNGNMEQFNKWVKANYDKGTVGHMISQAKESRGW